MSDDEPVHIELGFTLVSCDDCGDEHPGAVDCPVCGAGAEGDRHVDARRLALEPSRTLLAEAVGPSSPGPLDPGDWLADCGDWLTGFLAACAVEPAGQSPAIADAVEQLRAMSSAAAATPRLRPHVTTWRVLDELLASLGRVAAEYMTALCVATPDEGEVRAAEAQRAIDVAAAQVGHFVEHVERWQMVQDVVNAEPGAVGPLLALAAAAHQEAGTDFEGLTALGAEIAATVTGTDHASADSLVGLAVTRLQVDGLMDLERFMFVAGLAYRRMTGGHADLNAVVRSEPWLADFLELQRELADIGVEIRRASFEDTRLLARALLRAGSQLTERVAKFLLATVLGAHRRRDYGQLRAMKIGSLLSEAKQVGLGHLTYGWDMAIRHADAHKLFEVEPDGVRFTADKREYDWLSFDELLDRLLGSLESVLAVHTAVVLALPRTGVAVADVDPLTTLGLDAPDAVRVLLTLFGWTNVEADMQDGTLQVAADVPISPESHAFAAAVATVVGDGVEDATFVLRVGATTEVWSGPMDCIRAFGAAAERDKAARMVETLVRWTRDGTPIEPPTRIRSAAAGFIVQEESADFVALIRAAKPFLALARRLGDGDLEATLTTLIASWRQAATGGAPSEQFGAAVAALASYCTNEGRAA